ncbi:MULTISPECIES: hypothetical protein [unclassified Pseudomonas]|uniref:hypothetical protein n=1 Tax=unclassified Pseudomonas TaxID=196821 RepID=UPI0015AEBCE2|nr:MULTISPECIES: hypothetical protein [unclassified Pseudomonas]
MADESKREDLGHTPENAGKVGEPHKRANQQGEQPRHPGHENEGDTREDQNQDKP